MMNSTEGHFGERLGLGLLRLLVDGLGGLTGEVHARAVRGARRR